MFKSDLCVDDNYFYMPFGPTTVTRKDVGLFYVPFTNRFIDVKKRVWRKCKLYDTGWGPADGFERLPELNFDALIKLALCSSPETTTLKISEEESNKYGAIAVIMDRHLIEFISFLHQNIDNQDLFFNETYRNNLKLFLLDFLTINEKHKIKSLYNQQIHAKVKMSRSLKCKKRDRNEQYVFTPTSYADKLNCYPEWQKISDLILQKFTKN